MRKNYLKSFVFEVTLAFHGLGVLILTQDVLVELPVNSAEILEPCFDPFFALHHLVSEIVCIDVDADRADDTEFFPHNWDGGAFEFSAPDVELVVEFFSFASCRFFKSINKFVVPSRKWRPVTLFSSTISECDGSARLCKRISIPVFGNDFPISLT